MKENRQMPPRFFEKYSRMTCSRQGLARVVEPKPPEDTGGHDRSAGMRDELRRPMLLLVPAKGELHTNYS